ncbi:hypothetical protein AVEN_242013-1 [Araneus ventricosus]|uniref:Uncharacterized protein n=1 Tax=Araneus ventricosus TaxID=182803 RepID=A0A4Y2ECH8_ARAVE|nr:hypothetical protein AVEN_242013-1 [Araneus ventricosus]
MKHEANHRHQYQVLTQLKNNPSEDKMVLHIDFSANYACKLNAETQSFHFDGSHRHVTLHTGMIYYNKPNKYIKQGFCTISSSLHHDPCGIWAHLKPIFNHVVMLNPNVKQLHIISDSPTSQYCNKLNFYLFTKEIVKYFPALASSTWNYTGSGHGTGAPDGIGSIIKQSVDKAVTEGNDIPDVDALFTVLRERCTGIFVTTVLESDITVIEKSLPQSIKPLVSTMKVLQISWHKAKPSSIDARSLSCFKCNQVINVFIITLDPTLVRMIW